MTDSDFCAPILQGRTGPRCTKFTKQNVNPISSAQFEGRSASTANNNVSDVTRLLAEHFPAVVK